MATWPMVGTREASTVDADGPRPGEPGAASILGRRTVNPTRVQQIRDCVEKLVANLPTALHEQAHQSSDDPALRTWSYLPGDRPGVCLEDAPAPIAALVTQLVDLTHSTAGATLVAEAMAVEQERRRAVTGTTPSGDRYWWRMIGDPHSGRPWGWRLNGHHVAVHVVVDDAHVTLTPHFIGSEPAHLTSGPLAGQRILAPEEDLAREFLTALRPAQRSRAVATTEVPPDILTGMDSVADPSLLPPGITWPALRPTQQDLLTRLIDRYLGRAPADYASSCWREALADPDLIEFAWVGTEHRGSPHYYCVKTAAFLIEYDNTQDDANHAHSVWRHLRDDFGGDALREHRQRHHAQATSTITPT